MAGQELKPLIVASLPDPGPFGWGVCGRELTAALNEIARVVAFGENSSVPAEPVPEVLAPLLQAIEGVSLNPIRPWLRSSTKNVGYTFVEDNLAVGRYAENAKQYDHIATGSSWCTEALTNAGIKNVSTVIQGIHPRFFEAQDTRPPGEPFAIFVGGKAEFRKGQDVAALALSIFMDRHEDTVAVLCIGNIWPETVMSLRNGRIPGLATCKDAPAIIAMLRRHIPRFINYNSPVSHDAMPGIYANTDIGLFPNRCEAGTNLVMMEYMAAGKPVIATYATGHKDVLDPSSPFNLTRNTGLLIHNGTGQPSGLWAEPSLDEILEKLELAYDTYALAGSVEGQMNQDRMRKFTWGRCAEQLLELLVKP